MMTMRVTTQNACHSTWIGKMMTMNVNVITMSVNLMIDVTMRLLATVPGNGDNDNE